MMTGIYTQDTLKQKVPITSDTINQLADSAVQQKVITGDTVYPFREARFQLTEDNIAADTTAVCRKNRFTDVTFYDTNNIVTLIDTVQIDRFPFIFTNTGKQLREESKAGIIKHLKEGEERSLRVFQNDWIMPIILSSAFLYAFIRANSGIVFHGVKKFILSRGINENVSRDIGGLYHWQSTLLNLATFLNISLFACLTIIWFELVPKSIKPVSVWIISFCIIISAITLRHFICTITGNVSGEQEIFREYLLDIYQAYRFAGLVLFIFVILILYTTILPVKIYFIAGFCLAIVLYLIRVLRLFLIFLNRHVSIFYLILYLCALEILPVVILVKYVTGLV